MDPSPRLSRRKLLNPFHRIDLTWEGAHRRALLHQPQGEGPFPLVVALHGTGGSPRLMAMITNLNALANREGFAVVYPQALGEAGSEDHQLGAAWNAGQGCGSTRFAGADDAGFLRTLILKLQVEGCADPTRTYLCGLSNGGRMAYRMALEASDLLAAIAVVGGAWNGVGDRPAHSIPTIIFHGTEDRHIPYEGGRGALGRAIDHASVPDTVVRWVQVMGGAGKPRRIVQDGFLRDTATGPGVEVVLWTLPGEGHAWPGGRAWSPTADRPTDRLSASEEIWAFFKRFRREPS